MAAASWRTRTFSPVLVPTAPQAVAEGSICRRKPLPSVLTATSVLTLMSHLSRSGRQVQMEGKRNKRTQPGPSQALPRCVVFDLDGCLWSPEMYELSWDRGGAPFNYDDQGLMRDRRGCVISLHSGVERALTELATDKKWKGVNVAVASCCDVPPWAFELLGKFEFGPSKSKMNELITISQIHKGSKQGHLREIQSVVGCNFEDMIFFDNEPYNCQQVAGLGMNLRIFQASHIQLFHSTCQLSWTQGVSKHWGVTCIYCPEGVTSRAWSDGIEAFPQAGQTLRCWEKPPVSP